MSMSASYHQDEEDPFDHNPFKVDAEAEQARAAKEREEHERHRREREEQEQLEQVRRQGEAEQQNATSMQEQAAGSSQGQVAGQGQQQQPQQQRRPVRLAIRDNLNFKEEIKIIDAQKTTEGASTSYIAYIIRSHAGDTRHRYSEFESLRSVLTRLYPVLIVPPIPPHHSLTDYASKQGKAKEDASVIARRKRMLTVFLNRIGRHPILSEERVFQKFLEPNVPWPEVLHAPPVTLLPKNVLKASARTPADPSTSALYTSLPGPSSGSATGSASGYGQALQEPDQRFLDSEVFTNKFSAHLSGHMEKVNRRLMKRWSELSGDYAELGAVFNGFSLNEGSATGNGYIASMQGEEEQRAVESLSRAIEGTGQAIDSTYLHSNKMLQEWERSFTEPLAEYSQFSTIIKALLKYRHNKHLQFEMTRDTLEHKKTTLEELERSEQEARRLDQALDRALARVKPLDHAGQPEQQGPDEAAQPEGPSPDITTSRSGHQHQASSSSVASSNMKRSGSIGGSKFGFLGALSHTWNGMVDSDPEMTRRNNIGKTRDTINQLEGSISSITSDLRYANQMIQADLDRFQRQKVGDFRDMCLNFTKLHQECCRENMEMWKTAREAVEEIDDSPARLSPSVGGNAARA